MSDVLDACCGSRMFWFDSHDPRAIFLDNRTEEWTLKDSSSKNGSRSLVVRPDIVADFAAIPFPDESFYLVVFDPPHLNGNGESGWLAKKYGKLTGGWQEKLRAGFAECFRVLRANGVLVFKWNEQDIPVSEVLALTPFKPLFGNRSGKRSQSHWIVFMKDGERVTAPQERLFA